MLVIAVALILHKNLPRTEVVQITGTDVKRVDKSDKKSKDVQEGSQREKVVRTSDVRFINAVSRNGKVMVFRNEDTGWGWPPFFKFDSADLTAQAQAFSIFRRKAVGSCKILWLENSHFFDVPQCGKFKSSY